MDKSWQKKMVQKAKKGDAEAFIILCETYQNVLYYSAYKILSNEEDIKDCLQETEIKAWQKIKTLKNEQAFYSWIFKIMINIAKNILREKTYSVDFQDQNMNDVQENNSLSFLNDELDSLPDIYKIPLILYYYSGFDIKEIAEQLNLSSNTVKTRLSRGKQKIRISLEGVNYENETF